MKYNDTVKPVTRFAPSPTGHMHVGGARTALYAWAFARKNGGTFILRIEDTDKEREVEGSINQIVESLRWLGLDWDEGVDIGGPHAPYKQSERLESYKKYANLLYEKGLAYADNRSNEEINKLRDGDISENKIFLYRNYRPSNIQPWDGSTPLKMKITNIGRSSWNDLVRGDLEAGEESLDDFIIMKSDGYPTYNFAHIVDDLEMGVTHIFRADEFISSMPRFLALYEALSKVVPVQRPYFVSLPPIMGPDGKKKLGKRDGAKDLLDYKKDGILPSAMLNFLALIGWNPGTDQEIFTPQEFIQAFDISGIQTAGGALNEEKLLWFNKEHLKKLSDAEFLKQALPFIPCEISDRKDFNQKIKSIIPIIRERISVFKEITDMANQGELLMYFEAPTYNKELLLCPEKQRKGVEINLHGLIPHFEMLIKLIQSASESQPITKETAKNAVWDYADQQGRGIVLWALRTALSGKEKSPDPFVLLEILGTTDAVARLNNAINALHEK